MIECLVYVLIAALVAIVVVYIAETAVGSLVAMPPQVWVIVRLIAGLIVLLYALQCFGAGMPGFRWHPCP